MMCLDARLRGVRVLSERFASADGEAVEHAPRAVNGIDDLAGCADAQALLGGVRPPADPAVRAQLGELRGELAELKALGRTGRYREAVARGQALAKRVQALQYRPLEAEVLFETGQLERDVGGANAASRTMEQAVWAAEAGRNDEMAALAMTHLMFERATEGRFDEALAFRPRIAAVIERLGGNDDLEGHFHLTLGRVFFENSRLEESQAESEAGLAKLERHGDREALEVADGLDYLGETVLLRKGGSAARPIFERSLAIKRKIYGREHPEVAIA